MWSDASALTQECAPTPRPCRSAAAPPGWAQCGQQRRSEGGATGGGWPAAAGRQGAAREGGRARDGAPSEACDRGVAHTPSRRSSEPWAADGPPRRTALRLARRGRRAPPPNPPPGTSTPTRSRERKKERWGGGGSRPESGKEGTRMMTGPEATTKRTVRQQGPNPAPTGTPPALSCRGREGAPTAAPRRGGGGGSREEGRARVAHTCQVGGDGPCVPVRVVPMCVEGVAND